MKLQNTQIKVAHDAMTALLPHLTDIVLIFRVGQNIKAFAPIAAQYEAALRQILADNNAKHDGQTYINEKGLFQFETPEEAAAASRAFAELNALETDVQCEMLSLKRLEGNKKDIDAELLMGLLFMIEDDL